MNLHERLLYDVVDPRLVAHAAPPQKALEADRHPLVERVELPVVAARVRRHQLVERRIVSRFQVSTSRFNPPFATPETTARSRILPGAAEVSHRGGYSMGFTPEGVRRIAGGGRRET